MVDAKGILKDDPRLSTPSLGITQLIWLSSFLETLILLSTPSLGITENVPALKVMLDVATFNSLSRDH